MIELCERISCLEEDRARVEREVANLRSENGHLASVRDRADILQKKLDTLKAQVSKAVGYKDKIKLIIKTDIFCDKTEMGAISVFVFDFFRLKFWNFYTSLSEFISISPESIWKQARSY